MAPVHLRGFFVLVKVEHRYGDHRVRRKPKLSDYQRQEVLKRRAEGEPLAEIAKSYAVDISMISRLA